MRLLNTQTLQLEEFFSRIPRYAILSHTWEQEEVTFQDMKEGNAKTKAGYSKIKRSSHLAATDNWNYIWIDTCCIDKSSSAELSEAINSMYQWYENAEVCYAYLADVSKADFDTDSNMSAEPFRRCRWFTRGWTLQELIAPKVMIFNDRDWIRIGTKRTMDSILVAVTEIESDILQRKRSLEDVPVAKRMSWAAKRQTTRVEDTAYSLMGVFGVNMPLLYGEGKKAFTRLQDEIMKISDDHSLFAWTADPSTLYSRFYSRNLLAESPADFAGSRDLVPFRDWGESTPYFMTNMGLSIKLDVDRKREPIKPGTLPPVNVAVLNCWLSKDSAERVGIYLDCIEGDQYIRVKIDQLATLNPYGYTRQAMFIRRGDTKIRPYDNIQGGIAFQIGPEIYRLGYRLVSVYPPNKWLNDTFYPQTNRDTSSAGLFHFKNDTGRGFWALIGSMPMRETEAREFCLFRPKLPGDDVQYEVNGIQNTSYETLMKWWMESLGTPNGMMSVSIERVLSPGVTMLLVNFKRG